MDPKRDKISGYQDKQGVRRDSYVKFGTTFAKHNLKNNLDKWWKIQLTLWGKVIIIKMVVSPQLNYVLMMLPLTTPQLNKLCASRDKGGLGLPDPRLYQVSYEMAKLAKHWNNNTHLVWVTIEKTLSWPYSPIEHLSQCSGMTTNPIMRHSREVWAKIHKMHKISQCKQPYSSLGVSNYSAFMAPNSKYFE